MTVIDGKDLILGRLASKVAEDLLKGKKIDIINAEKVIMVGSAKQIYARYFQRVNRADLSNPLKGPKFPRMPDMLVRRTVRGMLPIRQARGQKAFKNLMVYIGVPKEFESSKAITVKEAEFTSDAKYITVEQLSRKLGANI